MATTPAVPPSNHVTPVAGEATYEVTLIFHEIDEADPTPTVHDIARWVQRGMLAEAFPHADVSAARS